MSEKQDGNDIEQMTLAITWVITVAVALLITACAGGLVVRVFLLVSGL